MDVAQKVEQFFSTYPTRIYEKKQILFHPEDFIEDVLYISTGTVRQYDISTVGNEIVVNIFKSGAFFPMSMALNKQPNSYFFEAASTVNAHVAPSKEVVAFLELNNDVTLDLLSRVYRGTDGVLRRMAYLMGGDARSRLLFELINGSYRFGSFGAEGSVTLRMSEGELASNSGLARETVNRELKKLKDHGLVRVGNGELLIADIDQLEAELGPTL